MLPSHQYLDQLGIPYQTACFPASTEKGAANVAHYFNFLERQHGIFITPHNLIIASNAQVINLTDRQKPIFLEGLDGC